MIFVGIDPGLTGGVAFLDDSGQLILAARTPIIRSTRGNRSEYDERAMLRLLRTFDPFDAPHLGIIEFSQAMPFDPGRSSIHKMGVGWGFWRMAMTACEIPYLKVMPAVWKKAELGPRSSRATGKQPSLDAAERLFHSAKERAMLLAKTGRFHDGMSEAALIAHHGFVTSTSTQRPRSRAKRTAQRR